MPLSPRRKLRKSRPMSAEFLGPMTRMLIIFRCFISFYREQNHGPR